MLNIPQLRIGLIGTREREQELNHMLHPYFEVDSLSDPDTFFHALPYRDVIAVDLAEPLFFQHITNDLKVRNVLVLVLTDGNGDMKKVDFGGLSCRFLQKPFTRDKWAAALDPNAPITLVVPDAGTVMTGKSHDVPKAVVKKLEPLVKKKAGRSRKKLVKKN